MALHVPETGFTAARGMAAATLMLAVCVRPQLPQSYFDVIRVVVCAIAAFAAFRAKERRVDAWLWAFGAVALVFNPFMPPQFTRDTWEILSLFGAGIFVASFTNPTLGEEAEHSA